MQKRAGDGALATTHGTEPATGGVADLGEKSPATGGLARAMELVPAIASTSGPQRAGREKRDPPPADARLRIGEGGRDREKPEHPVLGALGVDERLAEHHVAAAFAEDEGAARGGGAQAGAEAIRGGEDTGVEFGIAAGKIDRIRRRIGRFVGEGEKKQSSAPAARQPSRVAG